MRYELDLEGKRWWSMLPRRFVLRDVLGSNDIRLPWFTTPQEAAFLCWGYNELHRMGGMLA